MKVTPTSGLSTDEVDRIVKEGEHFKMADDLRRELAEIRNAAETLLYTTESALEGYADLVDADTLGTARALTVELRGKLDAQENLSSIKESYQRLEAVTFQIAEKMYGGDDGASGDAAPG